ncbi:MAG: sulfite exporter TauE/SafE family protein [Hahellaceae bacterium]|nr:sulfite exporter TauE/SafE family protein [Hahellaceae bacterium]
MDPTLAISAILVGIFGSAHCLAMCGGIACAPSFTGKGPGSPQSILLFNGGRLASYTLIGSLAGLLGHALALNPDVIVMFRSFAALLMIGMGLYIAQWWNGITVIEKVGLPLWSHLAPLAQRLRRQSHPLAPLLLGGIWGWLPCGLVYSALTWSVSSAEPGMAALLMLCFGLGTLPSMVSAGLFAYHIRQWLSRPNTRRVFGVLIISMGIWTFPFVHRLLMP